MGLKFEDPLTKRLFDSGSNGLRSHGFGCDHTNEEDVKDMIENPHRHGSVGKCHDWRNHITDEVAEMWEELPEIAKFVAYISADHAAGNEEWE